MPASAQDLAAVAAMVTSITDQYPAFAPLLKIPEVAELIIKASTPGAQWNSTKFQAQLQGTKWWKQNSISAQNWIVTQLTHPGEAARQQGAMAQQIHAAAATEGIVLKPGDLGDLVDNALKNGWTSGQIQNQVAQHAVAGTLHAGTVQATATNLGNIAGDYGVPVSHMTAFQWSKKIAAGTATQDGFTAYAQNQAKALYPHLGEQIDQGFTVRQIADPYLQVAQQLGVLANPATADLSHTKWTAALQGRDAKGAIVGPMTLDGWSRKIMDDPQYQWDRTDNARQAATSLVQSLGQTFGVSA